MLYQERGLKRELLGLVIGRYKVRILAGALTVLSEVVVAFLSVFRQVRTLYLN